MRQPDRGMVRELVRPPRDRPASRRNWIENTCRAGCRIFGVHEVAKYTTRPRCLCPLYAIPDLFPDSTLCDQSHYAMVDNVKMYRMVELLLEGLPIVQREH